MWVSVCIATYGQALERDTEVVVSYERAGKCLRKISSCPLYRLNVITTCADRQGTQSGEPHTSEISLNWRT